MPIALLGGLVVGVSLGYLLIHLFERFQVRSTQQMLLLMAISVLLIQMEDLLFSISPFIAIVSMGFVILEKAREYGRCGQKLSQVWILHQCFYL